MGPDLYPPGFELLIPDFDRVRNSIAFDSLLRVVRGEPGASNNWTSRKARHLETMSR